MGKHFWAGLFLLGLLPAFCLCITLAIQRIHEPVCQDLEQAQRLSTEEDEAQAYVLAQQAHSRWERFRAVSASFTDHEPIEAADSMFAELTCYAQSGSKEEFAACCARLQAQIRAVIRAARVSWWNLL